MAKLASCVGNQFNVPALEYCFCPLADKNSKLHMSPRDLHYQMYADNIDHHHNTRNNKSLLRLPLVKTENCEKVPLLSKTILFQ